METRPRQARGLRIVVNTQTPLIRFRTATGIHHDRPVRLADLPDHAYRFSTGGVTRMLHPLLRDWIDAGTLSTAEWVALSSAPRCPRVDHDGIGLSFVGMPTDERRGYAAVKEALWNLLNSTPTADTPSPALPDGASRAFEAHQARSALALQEAAERMGGLDLLYVHDFQQMGVARHWRGPDTPRLFHLHTPIPRTLPDPWRDMVVAHLEGYDAVVVSTPRYAANLQAAGLRRPVHVIPPFIDPRDFHEARPSHVREFRARHGIAPEDRVILNVGRMDPVKGQDRLIHAMPRILREVPDARLVLVGNGSFSSSARGGLGLPKGARWRASLESLAKSLRIDARVTFTGHLEDTLLPAAYEACDVFCLPSTREGFGLAAVEAWLRAKPVLVSHRTGVAEFVQDGENGVILDCADADALARSLVDLLLHPEQARAMGEAGALAAEQATLPVGRRGLESLIERLLEGKPLAAR